MPVSTTRHIINILLTELSRSVWENLDLGRVYRPHSVRSVLTTSVKILPYRPPARLIRAKYLTNEFVNLTFNRARVSSVRFCSIVYHSAIQKLNFSMADYQGNRSNKSYYDCSQSLSIHVGEFSQSKISEKMPFPSESLIS